MNAAIPAILQQKAKELKAYYEAHFPALAPLAEQCFLNTIQTTVKQLDDGSYFVITGDIPAMWLRDSAAQVKPYIKYAAEDADLQKILEGVIAKQAECVCIDPYANAFNEGPLDVGAPDDTWLDSRVWERKYEVDSLCAPLYLSYEYWKTTGKETIFTKTFLDMLRKILHTFTEEQDHSRSSYYFRRSDCPHSDTLTNRGKGRPVNVTGMTWSGFRPSDDACRFGYLIPSNMMAYVALGYGEEMLRQVYHDEKLAEQYAFLRDEIYWGIEDYAVVHHPKYGEMYAYETDGFGNYHLMDDANSPSLLAMPYLGFCGKDNARYQNTRAFILSKDNPYFAEGALAKGVGSPHTPEGYVWHIGITMQALTSNNREEILSCLKMLSQTHAGTCFMHESFHPDRPEEFTRPWFAWANTLFAQLLDQLKDEGFFEQ